MSDTFNTYGFSFQIKLLASLFNNKIFLQQISDILDSNYFESDSNKWIATTVIDYFNEYKSSPTLEVMKVRVDSVDNEVLKTGIIDTLKEEGFTIAEETSNIDNTIELVVTRWT